MIRLSALFCAVALTVSACALPEPEPVYAQPSFDKTGNAHCMDGYSVMTTDTGQSVCAPDA